MASVLNSAGPSYQNVNHNTCAEAANPETINAFFDRLETNFKADGLDLTDPAVCETVMKLPSVHLQVQQSCCASVE